MSRNVAPTDPDEWRQRRRALEDEAAALGLTITGPARLHGRVQVRMEGAPSDVDRLVTLLERRGIALQTPSEQAPASHGSLVKQFVSIDLSNPAHRVGDAAPGRRLWTQDTPTERWVAQLLTFEDEAEWCGLVEKPWPYTPHERSLPAPLLDSAGWEIGQVLEFHGDSGKLFAAGEIAKDQTHQLLLTPHLTCLLPLHTVADGGVSWSGRSKGPRQRLVTGWTIPAVRLTTQTPTTWVRLDAETALADLTKKDDHGS
ncbi:hypothetical protein ACIBEJ_00380 [Nonomuraea sp. NPDC050790]|uniref:hypothetical protein n=1 Tax=Nonomuraea sp. NPDC050790 TaxID=3364371 RepID=UPI0037943F2F